MNTCKGNTFKSLFDIDYGISVANTVTETYEFVKGKTIPLQALTGPWGSRRLRLL